MTVEETEDTILQRDGNGALLRRHKKHDATPEHVDFLVKDRAAWEEQIKPKLRPDRRRIDFEGYRRVKRYAHEQGRFFAWSGVNVFELMHPRYFIERRGVRPVYWAQRYMMSVLPRMVFKAIALGVSLCA